MANLAPYVADLDALDAETAPLRVGGNPTVRQIANAAIAIIAECKVGRGEVRWDEVLTKLFTVSDADITTIIGVCDQVLAGNFNEAAKSIALCVRDAALQVRERRVLAP